MLTNILLQATASPFGEYGQYIFFGAMILIFYFFMIRPQQKKQSDQKTFASELKRGDKVVTIGGMHGKVAAIEDNLLTIEFEKGVKIKFDKASISAENSKIYSDKS